MRQKSGPKESSAEKHVQAIKRQTRRKFSAEEKIRIVLEGLRGEYSIAELCRREGQRTARFHDGTQGVSHPQNSRWFDCVPYCQCDCVPNRCFWHAQNLCQYTSNCTPDMFRRTRSDDHQIDVLAIAGRGREKYFVQERSAAHRNLRAQKRVIKHCRHCPA